MRITIYLLLLILTACITKELTPEQKRLKKNAISLQSLSKLENEIYDNLAPYEIILIGEMHGTNEPAIFASGVCNLITEHEDKVIMAMEISPSQMEGFKPDMSIDQLKDLNFFAGENSSGMNGEAWLNLIHECNQNDNIIVKFFDYQRVAPRDSSMYNAIVDIRKAHPNSKIVTLSGNMHNRQEPYNDNMLMGCYLMKDSINFNADKICSIMHFYNQGTMLNNMGNGLELKTIEGKENIFNTTLSSDILFVDNIYDNLSYFTHILYTDKVTHSKKLEDR